MTTIPPKLRKVPPRNVAVTYSEALQSSGSLRVWAKWHVNGKQDGTSQTFKPTEDQDERIAQWKRALERNAGAALDLDILWREFIEAHKEDALADLAPATQTLYEGSLKNHVLPHWGRQRVVKLAAADIRAWARTIRAESTKRNAVATLKRFAAIAYTDGYLRRNPFDDISIKKPKIHTEERPIIPSEAEVTRVMSKVKERHALYGEFLHLTCLCALRIGEAQALQVRDWDPANSLLHVRRQYNENARTRLNGNPFTPPKDNSARAVPVSAEAAEILEKHCKEGEKRRGASELIFVGPKGGILLPRTIRQTLNWKKLIAELGYPGLVFHDLRHTGLTHMLRKLSSHGLSIEELRRFAGHKSVTTTQRYLHMADDSFARAVQALNASDTVSS